MRIVFFSNFLACSLFAGAAHAVSCMPNEAEGKASLCYHKSADGRCVQFGPPCQTEVVQTPAAKPSGPVIAQSASGMVKK